MRLLRQIYNFTILDNYYFIDSSGTGQTLDLTHALLQTKAAQSEEETDVSYNVKNLEPRLPGYMSCTLAPISKAGFDDDCFHDVSILKQSQIGDDLKSHLAKIVHSKLPT